MQQSAAPEAKAIVFFAPDVTDVSTIKRAEAFLEYGYRLLMFSFRRRRYNSDYQPVWPFVMLGHTEDGRYGQRLRALLAAIPRIMMHWRSLRRAEVFYARNIDQLLLALVARWLSGRRARIVYEVLDIQPVLVGRRLISRLLRMIERFGLRRVELLVLSSPAFWRNYYASMQDCRQPWFLLENKLPAHFGTVSRSGQRPVPAESRRGYRWTVGYCGLIRGQATFDLIVRLAAQLQGIVQFKFRGLVTTVDRESFEREVARLDNLVYEGPYVSPDDLHAVYGDLDFAWALDLENTEHNSRWLLPCRFYEAGYFGVPCLTAKGFEVAGMVEGQQIGWSFQAPYEESLLRFFRELTPEAYTARQRRLQEKPAADFVAGEDSAILCRLMENGLPADSAPA